MDIDYWTIEALENASEKDVKVEDKFFRIKAVDPKILILLFDGKDAGKLDNPSELSTDELIKNLKLLDEVIVNGLVKPSLGRENIDKLGRFKNPLAQEILAFSGLGKKEADDVESFREEPDGSNG